MKKIIYITAIAVTTLVSCDRIEMLDNKDGVLNISVRNSVNTKTVVEGTTLPSGSEIGLFIADQNGVAYDGNYLANVKYTATGEGDSQNWNAVNEVMLSATVANVNSYYPYDESVTDITSIPIEATSDVQKDWMWGTPVSGLDNKNPNAIITMNHALAVVRLNLVKGSFVGTGKVTSVSFNSNGAATSAILNAKNGMLKDKRGHNTLFNYNEEFTLSNEGNIIDFIVVPGSSNAVINMSVIVNGEEMKATTSEVTLEAGKLYEYTVFVGVEELQLNKVNVTEWSQGEVLEQMLKPSVPKVTLSGTKDNIRFEQSYANKTLTIKAIPTLEGYPVKEVSVTGGVSTQSVDENGVRTIVITNIVSDVTVIFSRSTYVPWARIQHVDGTLYTAEEWIAAEEAGTVTDADANGVAVRYSQYASCPHVIHKEESKFYWSNKSLSSTEYIPYISELSIINSFVGTNPKSPVFYEINGKTNTEAILAAVANGYMEDAPAAQYCAGITFANGKQGYLPASGEITSWHNNKDVINSCLEAISGGSISTLYWTSTADMSYSDRLQPVYYRGDSNLFGSSAIKSNYLVRAITELNL